MPGILDEEPFLLDKAPGILVHTIFRTLDVGAQGLVIVDRSNGSEDARNKAGQAEEEKNGLEYCVTSIAPSSRLRYRAWTLHDAGAHPNLRR